MTYEPKPDWETEQVEEVKPYSLTNTEGNWFQNLSQPLQVAVLAGGVVVGLAILNIFLKILTSILTILVLGAILYAVYRFFLQNKS